MKTLLNLLHFGLVGAGIGSMMTIISMLALGTHTASVKEFALWITASVVMGIATMLMFTDKIKPPLATTLHFMICFTVVIVTAFLCSYIDAFSIALKRIVPMFIIIYVIVYVIIFMTAKMNEKSVNKALNNK